MTGIIVPAKLIYAGVYASSAGTVAAVLGAVTNDQVLTWSAVVVAMSGTIVTAMVAAYHKIREAARAENEADRKNELEGIRALAKLQVELEARVSGIEDRAKSISEELKARKSDIDSALVSVKERADRVLETIDRIKCRFPDSDGTARCEGKSAPEIG